MSDQYQQPPSEWKYWAFISYSHADEKWADWLHKAIETYGVPPQLVGKPTKYGPIPKRPYPVFRDRDELPSSADLGEKLTQALWLSRYLIVVCSPRSVASQWVNEEIKTYKSMGREDQVLCLIVDGEPYASHNPQLGLEECFPEPVRYRVDSDRQLMDIRTEPIAADARKGKDGKQNSRLKIISGMFGVNFSDLKQRDHERQQKRLKIILAGISVLMMLFLIMGIQLFRSAEDAKQKEKEARDNETRALKSEEIAKGALGAAKQAAADAERERDRAKAAEEEAVKARDIAEQQKEAAVKAREAEAAAKRATDKALEQEKTAREAEEQAKNQALANLTRAETAEAEAKKNAEEAIDARKRATMALSISDFNEATRLIDEKNESTAIALLARSLDLAPELSSTEGRLISVLGDRNWPLPRTRPIPHPGPVVAVSYCPDGKSFATAAGNQAYLWNVATGEPIGAPLAHKGAVNTVNFSPDGKRIVTASDPVAQVWDAATGQPVGSPMQHNGRVNMARFSPSGEFVVTASQDRTAKVWSATTGTLISTIALDGIAWTAEFSPDSTRIVVTYENSARVLDAASGRPVGSAMQHQGGVFDAAFSPDGTKVATVSGDRTARIWDAASGAAISQPLQHGDKLNDVAFSPDGRHLATACADGTARVWDVASGAAVGEPLRHDLQVNHVEFSPNGLWLATSSDDRTVKVWDVETGRKVAEPIKFDGAVRMTSFAPGGGQIAVASADATAQIWTCLSGKPQTQVITHGPFRINWAAFSSDSRYVVTACRDRSARVWELGSGKPVTEPLTDSGEMDFAVFSPDDKFVLTVSQGGSAKVWEVATSRMVCNIRHRGGINSAVFSPDGKSILTSSQDRTAQVWDAATGQPKFGDGLKHDGRIVSWAIYSPDGSLVITAGEDGTARTWNAATGQPTGKVMKHDRPLRHVAISADGKMIATASEDRTARVWDAMTGEPLTPGLRHDGYVNWVAFSPDGHKLVSASDDQTVRVWKPETGQPMAEPLQHQGKVLYANFSSDSQMLVTCGFENLARVWEANSWKLVRSPLTHGDRVRSATFSKDGSFVATTSDDNTAKVWQVAIPGDAPDWLAKLAETVGGFRMDEAGGAVLIKNPWKNISALREEIGKLAADNPYAIWGNWFLADRTSRTVSPYATRTVSDYVSGLAANGDAAALREALQIQPNNAVALARLGQSSSDLPLSDFYSGLAAQYEPNNYQVLWMRGSVLQRLSKFGDALAIMKRALEQDPRAVKTFGPTGDTFQSSNRDTYMSKGWLPKGWLDNSSDASVNVVYSQIAGPPGADTGLKIATDGQRGNVEVLGPRFLVPAQSRAVIQGFIRCARRVDVTVEGRQFMQPFTKYGSEFIRTTEQWKPFRVTISAREDLAGEVALRFAAYGSTEVEIAGVVVTIE